MTKYILHGGFTSVKNKLNETFYEECTKGLKDSSTVLFIYFAREDKDTLRLFEEDKKKILETTEVKNLNMVIAGKEKFTEQFQATDVVYIRGGDTKKLLETLKQFPRFVEGLDGKIIVGSSAGAYAFATCYHSGSRGGVHKGLGLLPIRIICHYQSEVLPAVDDAMKVIKECDESLELVVLKDFEWKVLEK